MSHLSIRAKLTIALISCAIFTPACLVIYSAIQEEQTQLEKRRQELQHQLQTKSQFANSLLDTSARDVLFLSQVPAVRIFSSTEFSTRSKHISSEMLDQFAEINSIEVFVDYLKTNPLYKHLTYLDNKGKERLRINQLNDTIEVVDRELLQDKSTEPYFITTATLSKGDVYISDFVIDNAQNPNSDQLKPVIHLATQVYDKRGILQGILVIDVSAEILSGLVHYDRHLSEAIYLIDSQGHFLAHPDAAKKWSKQLDNDFKLQNDIPGLDDLPKHLLAAHNDKHIVTLQNEVFISPLITEQKQFNDWYFVAVIPRAEMIGSIQSYLYIVLFISLFGIIFSLILGYTFSKFWLLNPIRKLTAITEKIAQGSYATTPLTTRQKDELGQLCIAFNQMSQTLGQHEQERNNHVQDLNNEIAERKKVESDLLLHRTFFEQSTEAMFIADEQSRFIYINPAFRELTGFSNQDVIGNSTDLLQSNHHASSFYKKIWNKVNTTGHWQGEVWECRKNRENFPALQTINTISNEKGDKYYVSIFKDLSNLREKDNELWNLAHFDQLTNLPNRKYLQEKINKAISDTYRHNHIGALIYLDIDNFKIINDSLGHNHGDLLLKEIATRLEMIFGGEGTIARPGGDEFVILLPDLGVTPDSATNQATIITQKIIESLNASFLNNDHELHVTTSIGIVLFPSDGDTPDNLLKQAETAMYTAKGEGKNTFCFYHSDMQSLADRRLKLGNELRIALKQNQFTVYYQPQFNQDLQLIGYEALIRWLHPDRGIVSPDRFISIAEESDLILEIGNLVLLDVCDKLVRSQNNGCYIPQISVNISPRQFSHPSFIEWVQHTLEKTGAEPSRLVLEVTEGVIIKNLEGTITNMQRLKKIGIRFSIDDFGTGYSSLAYLKQLPINELKIDRSFVCDIEKDQNSSVIVDTIVSMAQQLDLDLIAEGVETQEQLDYLISCGCNGFQGYLFGHPIQGDALITEQKVAIKL